MSHYIDCKLAIKDPAALIEALLEHDGEITRYGRRKVAWTKDVFEIHAEPQHLLGFQGDVRQQKAHIIIRRENVGGAANDIGFLRNEDGTYTAIISAYDRNAYNDTWLKNVCRSAAMSVQEQQLRAKGYTVQRKTQPNGHVQIVAMRAR